MYDYNNKDKTLEEGLNDWYLSLNTERDKTHTYKESRVTQILQRIWKAVKPFLPFTSTKGCCK